MIWGLNIANIIPTTSNIDKNNGNIFSKDFHPFFYGHFGFPGAFY